MRSGDVPLAYSSCIRRLINISKTDMSFTSYIRRRENVALNGARGKLQFFHGLGGDAAMCSAIFLIVHGTCGLD